MTVLNGEVLFRGLDANGQINLWVTNGTAQGTHELAGIADAYAGYGGMNAHAITAGSWTPRFFAVLAASRSPHQNSSRSAPRSRQQLELKQDHLSSGRPVT